MKRFLLKNKWNLLFLLGIGFILIPQTGMPIKVTMNRLFAFSPSEEDKEDRAVLENYSWNLESLDGRQLNFATSEGNVTIVNFWATWCPPCVAEMPSLQKLYDAFGDSVDFYFVSAEHSEKLSEFIKKKNYTLPVYVQKTEAPSVMSYRSIPTTFLISKQGEIVIHETGAANWNSDKVHEIIEQLLSKD